MLELSWSLFCDLDGNLLEVTLKSVLVTIGSQPQRPSWLRAPAPVGANYQELKEAIETICELNHDLLRPERAASKKQGKQRD